MAIKTKRIPEIGFSLWFCLFFGYGSNKAVPFHLMVKDVFVAGDPLKLNLLNYSPFDTNLLLEGCTHLRTDLPMQEYYMRRFKRKFL